jgi:acyl-coenzyme A thioesterase PaaI-like protein
MTGAPAATQSIHELFAHIGFRDYRNADGDLVVELPVAPHVVNTNGGLQGGLLATLVDIAAGRLAIADMPPDVSVVTSRRARPARPRESRTSGKRSISAPRECRRL